MPFSFAERPGSGNSTKESYELLYRASGSDDAAFVRAYSLGGCPSVVTMPEGILYRQDVSVQPQGHKLFFVTATYAPRKKENGTWRFTFDTQGGTVHIKQSKQSIKRYPDTQTPRVATNFNGLIGVTKDGPAGVEIVIPALKITVHFKHPLGVISLSQVQQLAYNTGMVNSDTFLKFQPGEVLFLGAKGSEGTDAETEVAYDFAISRNASVANGNPIRVLGIEHEQNFVLDPPVLETAGPFYIEKKGHELVWISYEPSVDPDSATAAAQPSGVYVERVYDTACLSQVLGFGA